jgi:hypothetical protein
VGGSSANRSVIAAIPIKKHAAVTGAAVTGEVTQAATLFEDDSFEQSGALAAWCTPTNNPGFDFVGMCRAAPGTSWLA